MTTNKPTLQEYAMRYGTAMGIFWMLKFILFPLGMHTPFLQVLFFFLTIFVGPIWGYLLTKKYRDTQREGIMSFSHSFLFTAFMYMFAALFVSIIHYVYFRYIDNGLIVSTYQDMLNQMTVVATGEMKESMEQFHKALDIISNLTPLEITLQLLTQNIFYCSMLAVPTALLVMRNKKK